PVGFIASVFTLAAVAGAPLPADHVAVAAAVGSVLAGAVGVEWVRPANTAGATTAATASTATPTAIGHRRRGGLSNGSVRGAGSVPLGRRMPCGTVVRSRVV